jgi:hypothetical protein
VVVRVEAVESAAVGVEWAMALQAGEVRHRCAAQAADWADTVWVNRVTHLAVT